MMGKRYLCWQILKKPFMKEESLKTESTLMMTELVYHLVMEDFFILGIKEWKIDQSWVWMGMGDKLY